MKLLAPIFEYDARAPRPGLLTRVDNGVGAVTDVRYDTIQELMGAAQSDGTTWSHRVPVVAPVVTKLRTHNKPAPTSMLAKPYELDRATAYSYSDPAYDTWTRRFTGFRLVRVQNGSESAVTQTTYWFGPCQQEEIIDACIAGSDNEPDKALVGLPVRVDRLIPGVGQRPARWLSSTEISYDNRLLLHRRHDVHAALVAATETYDYDPDQRVDTRAPTRAGNFGAGDERVHSPIQGQRAPIIQEFTTDDYGNVTRTHSRGRQPDGLDALLLGTASLDDVIVTWLGSQIDGDLPGPVRCDAEHWRCFVDQLSITTDQGTDHGFMLQRKFRFSYAPQGDLASVDGWLNAGSGSLDRFHATGQPVAPLPPGASAGFGWRRLSTYDHDAQFGGITSVQRPGSPVACTTIRYDAAFLQLPSEVVVHGNGCASSGLRTRMVSDRGFEAVTKRVEASGATTDIELDPFGRAITVRSPSRMMPIRSTIEALTLRYTDRSPLSWVG